MLLLLLLWDGPSHLHPALAPATLRPGRLPLVQANAARLMWNASGTALLALTAADVDATNQSYYGEQKLYFMAADGSNECAVPLPKVLSGVGWRWAVGRLGGVGG